MASPSSSPAKMTAEPAVAVSALPPLQGNQGLNFFESLVPGWDCFGCPPPITYQFSTYEDQMQLLAAVGVDPFRAPLCVQVPDYLAVLGQLPALTMQLEMQQFIEQDPEHLKCLEDFLQGMQDNRETDLQTILDRESRGETQVALNAYDMDFSAPKTQREGESDRDYFIREYGIDFQVYQPSSVGTDLSRYRYTLCPESLAPRRPWEEEEEAKEGEEETVKQQQQQQGQGTQAKEEDMPFTHEECIRNESGPTQPRAPPSALEKEASLPLDTSVTAPGKAQTESPTAVVTPLPKKRSTEKVEGGKMEYKPLKKIVEPKVGGGAPKKRRWRLFSCFSRTGAATED